MTRLSPIMCLLMCLLVGCSTPKVPRVEPVILLWSEKTIDRGQAKAWSKEIDRVEKSPYVLVMVHGGDRIICDKDGKSHSEWWTAPDVPRIPMRVEDQAAALFNEYCGTRVIWLVCCNAGGHTINVPDVRYARRIVWATPDAATPLFPFRDHSWIGRPEEFTWSGVRLAGER